MSLKKMSWNTILVKTKFYTTIFSFVRLDNYLEQKNRVLKLMKTILAFGEANIFFFLLQIV